MDLKGSLIDDNLRIYPSEKLKNYLATLSVVDETPTNLLTFLNGKDKLTSTQIDENIKPAPLYLTKEDLENINKIKQAVKNIQSSHSLGDSETGSDNSSEKDIISKEPVDTEAKVICEDKDVSVEKDRSKEKDDPKAKGEYFKEVKDIFISNDKDYFCKESLEIEDKTEDDAPKNKKEDEPYLLTSDLDWLYFQLQKRRNNGQKDVPYLYVLLEESRIEMPENTIIKRNPDLEARCIKLRAQQEAREYRKMTKGVDNVRLRFPEDSISYQLKQVNRQLIAVGQFILSIFAGFLFGFKGVEWAIGPLDFGFRLLLGVMCALVIALAEIYFLAKKLNEELNIPETVQLGGPPKFADESKNAYLNKPIDKEHQD